MSTTVPIDPVAAKVAALTADVDALDRGVLEAGLIAAEANARSKALEAVLRAAGIDDTDVGPAETLGDIVAAGIEYRKRKAEAPTAGSLRPGCRSFPAVSHERHHVARVGVRDSGKDLVAAA